MTDEREAAAIGEGRRLVQVRLDADLVKAVKVWAIERETPWPLAMEELLRRGFEAMHLMVQAAELAKIRDGR